MLKLYKSIFKLGVLALVSLLSSDSRSVAQPIDSTKELSARIAELERQVSALQATVTILKSHSGVRYATLDCNSGSYMEVQVSRSNMFLLVSCSKVEPYLEGHKVTLDIGNPYAADIRGISVTLRYGKDLDEMLQTLRNVKVDYPERLPSGQWTPVVVTLNPSKSEQLRHVGVEVDVATIVLGLPK